MSVIVVGAGVAGVTAAAELVKKGIKVTVLEARNRLGGRLYTDRTSGSAPYELGCSWIHESLDNPLWKIAEDAGIECVYDDNVAVFDSKGPLDPKLELGKVNGDFSAFAALELANNAGGKDLSLAETVKRFQNAHPKLSTAQRASIAQFVRLPQLSNGVDWNQVSMKAVTSAANKGRDLLVVGGYDKVYDKLKEPIPSESILLSTAVKSIEYSNNKVVVEAEQASGSGTDPKPLKLTADNVIVTVPAAVLKSGQIQFSPALPSELSTAIANTSAAKTGKVYLEFDSVFWPENDDKFVFVGDGSEGPNASAYPLVISNWYRFNGKLQKPGLAVITPPPLTDEFEADSSKAFASLKPVLESLRTDKSKPVPTPTKVTTSKWSVDKFSQGSYSTYTVGHSRADSVAQFEKGLPGVLFAGEHTILRGATFAHGAYRSGIRAALQVQNSKL